MGRTGAEGDRDSQTDAERQVPHQGELWKVVQYMFYQKPMVNRVSNLERSASPEGQIVSTATQEVIRRFKTTSRDLDHKFIEKIIKDYMEDLKNGGCSLQWRMNILEAAGSGYEKM